MLFCSLSTSVERKKVVIRTKKSLVPQISYNYVMNPKMSGHQKYKKFGGRTQEYVNTIAGISATRIKNQMRSSVSSMKARISKYTKTLKMCCMQNTLVSAWQGTTYSGKKPSEVYWTNKHWMNLSQSGRKKQKSGLEEQTSVKSQKNCELMKAWRWIHDNLEMNAQKSDERNKDWTKTLKNLIRK